MNQNTSLSVDPAELRKSLEAAFSVAELRSLCHDLAVDAETLNTGGSKSELALAIVAFYERRHQMPKLVAKISELRPDVLERINQSGQLKCTSFNFN